VGASYSNGPRCPSVCLSHANISETKQDRHVVTRKLQWEIRLPNSESAIRFTIESMVLPFWVSLGLHFSHTLSKSVVLPATAVLLLDTFNVAGRQRGVSEMCVSIDCCRLSTLECRLPSLVLSTLEPYMLH